MKDTEVTRLTQDAYDRLKHELDEMIENRPVIAARVNDAREEGDLGDHASYHAAREQQAQAEARIRHLQELLRNAKIGEPSDDDTAGPGKILTVRFEDDDEDERFLLANREDGAASDLDVYSPASPLGKTLLGARVGESREYELPSGRTIRVTLVSAVPREVGEHLETRTPKSGTVNPNREGSAELHATHAAIRAGRQHIFQNFERTPSTEALPAVPVSIYLASEVNASEVELALVELLDEVGVDFTESMPPIIGSWLGLSLARFRRWLSSDQADEVVARIERAVEVRLLGQPQAEVDSKQAEAVARLMTALEKQDSACIQVGSLFLLKVDGIVVARNLSPAEMAFLTKHPSVLKTPRQVLDALEESANQPAVDMISPEKDRPALARPEAKPRNP